MERIFGAGIACWLEQGSLDFNVVTSDDAKIGMVRKFVTISLGQQLINEQKLHLETLI